jgi:FkbM family methyltransferase
MTFVSHAQNFEDLMLWRALSDVRNGFYIDVGASNPDSNTVTRAFYERGWSGVNIEPDPASFQALVRRRERDVNLPIALADAPGERRFYTPAIPGLATLESAIAFQHRARGMEVRRSKVEVQTLAEICRRHAPADIHFLNIDVEGAEGQVLRGADFTTFRPWIVLAEATLPLTQQEIHATWEPLLVAAAYRFVWFDGLNRFYVAEERHAELSPHFRLPPNCFDQFKLADREKDALAAELQMKQAELQTTQAELQVLQARLAQLRNLLRHAAEQTDNW